MEKSTLVYLVQKDIEELQQLTKGFSEMESFPAILIDLASDKAQRIVDNLVALKSNQSPVYHAAPVISAPADEYEAADEAAAAEPQQADEAPAPIEAEQPEAPAETARQAAETAEPEAETGPEAEITVELPPLADDKAPETEDEVKVDIPDLDITMRTEAAATEPEAEPSEDTDEPEYQAEDDMPEAEPEAGPLAQDSYEEDDDEIQYVEADDLEADGMVIEADDMDEPSEAASHAAAQTGRDGERESRHDSEPPSQTLFELLSKPAETRNDAAMKQHVDDIRQGISIGDSFLFQRELFRGNGELMIKTINRLNEYKSMRDAERFVVNKLGWDMEDETVQRFMQIVARRFV